MNPLTTLANQLKTSPVLLTEIKDTLESNGVEATQPIIEDIFLRFIKGNKGVKGGAAAMSYLAQKSAEQAREKTQPQLGLMQNMQTLRSQLVEQFDPVTSSVADDVNAELVRRTVAKTVGSNLDKMPKTKALLDQVGLFSANHAAGFTEDFNADQSMSLLLGSVASYKAEASPSFLLSASTQNLLNPSEEILPLPVETIAKIAA